MGADLWAEKGVKTINTILVMETATTQEQFEHAHQMIDEKHAAYNKVYVDSLVIKNLLYDHSQFCGILEDSSLETLVKIKHGTFEASQEAEHCYRNYRDLTNFTYEENNK